MSKHVRITKEEFNYFMTLNEDVVFKRKLFKWVDSHEEEHEPSPRWHEFSKNLRDKYSNKYERIPFVYTAMTPENLIDHWVNLTVRTRHNPDTYTTTIKYHGVISAVGYDLKTDKYSISIGGVSIPVDLSRDDVERIYDGQEVHVRDH